MKVPLSRIAHTRSGDKGDTCNVGVIALREEDYCTAARLMGAKPKRIIARHLLPGFMSHLIASATLVRCSAPWAARASFKAERTCERTARFRTRRRSFCRIRFTADFVFATW